jgi:hypothetical protein
LQTDSDFELSNVLLCCFTRVAGLAARVLLSKLAEDIMAIEQTFTFSRPQSGNDLIAQIGSPRLRTDLTPNHFQK